MGEFALRVHLRQGATGDRNGLQVLATRLSGVPFGDIGGHRNGRSTQLIRQTIELVSRKTARYLVNPLCQIHPELPHAQVPKALDLHLQPPSSTSVASIDR